MKTNDVWASRGRVSLLAAALLLAACGTRYQAPLDDQSARMDRQRAPIYTTTTPSSASGVVISGPSGVEESRPVGSASRGTSAPSGTSGTSAVAAGVRVEPAPGVNVNVVGAGSGIQRRSIDRAPAAGQPPTVGSGPSAQAPVSQTPAATPDVPAVAATPRYPDEAVVRPPQSQTQSQPSSVPATHTVARGDTLYSIAYQYSLDYRALAVANNLSAPYTIYLNQQLSLNIGGVSNNALESVPSIPPAPAGDTEVLASGRPAEAMASRRMTDVPVRVVDDISWQWPVEGQVLRGFRGDTTSISRGIDIGGRRGDPVYAAADGDVVYSGRGIQGQGNLIIIRHGTRHLSAYSHNSNMLVTEGARIRAGDKIAEIGDDGRGSELLHFEVRVDGAPVDPSRYLPIR